MEFYYNPDNSLKSIKLEPRVVKIHQILMVFDGLLNYNKI
jgi:hypothetical protein